MSAALSAILNPSAGSAAARAATRAVAANDKAAEQDNAGSPFADLMSSGPAEAKAASSEAKASKAAKGERPVDKADDEQDRDDDSKTAAADATPALPAWLQALREPAPLPATGASAEPIAAAGDGAAALAALAGSVATGRSLKADASAAASAVPTTTAGDTSGFGSALAAAADADPAAVLPQAEPGLATADTRLSATQNTALVNALDQLTTKTDLPASLVAAVSNDRSTAAVTTATPPPADAASLLAAGQSTALDAYGEPLSLDGPDAAIRLGERLRWLNEAGVQEARLQLHPKELGAIDIRIRVEHQTANVWFGADHPAARAALESTLPQLRERLAADGLQLGQAQVGTQTQNHTQSQGQGGRQESGTPFRGDGSGARGSEPVAAVPASDRLAAAVARHRGLVDRYA